MNHTLPLHHRARIFKGFIGGLLAAFFALPLSAYAADPSLSLSVKNDTAYGRHAEWTTSGVPIPQDWQATDPTLFVVTDAEGAALPTQVNVTARWGSAPDRTDRPIKWLLVTFPVTAAAGEEREYTLSYGSPSSSSQTVQIVEDSAERMEIDTGKAQFTLSKANLAIFETVVVDGVAISDSPENGFVLLDDLGNRYTTANDTPTEIAVEEPGPARLVLRLKGSLRNDTGEGFLDYIAHLTFYAGESYVRILFTVGNHREAIMRDWGGYYVFDYGDPNSVNFESLALSLSLADPSQAAIAEVMGASGPLSLAGESMAVYQDSSGYEHWDRYAASEHEPRLGSAVRFRGYQTAVDGTTEDEGHHHAGWMDLSDGEKGIAVGIRDFSENYPKGLKATADGKIEAELFPEAFSAAFNFRVGEEKTHDLVVYFHGGDLNAGPLVSGLMEPLFARAAPEWYVLTGAIAPYTVSPGTIESRFGETPPSDDETRWEYYGDRTVAADPIYTGSYYYPFHSLWESTSGHPSSTEYFDFYGWSWFGNQPLEQESVGDGQSGPFNDKYDLSFGSWIEYLRSGDARWRDMGEAISRHVEALMLHDVETNTGWDIARWKNAIFGHSQHNEAGDINSVRNHLGPVMDTTYGVRGSTLYYYLTGYPPSKRFVEDAARAAYDFYKDTQYESNPEFAPSREAGNLLSVLVEGFRLTGESNYQQLIQGLIEDYAASKQPWINGPVEGSTVSIPTWIFGLYYTAIGRYLDLADEYGLVEEKARALSELEAYLDWHLTYATREPSGWTSTYYYWNGNGDNDPNDTSTVNNWTLLLSDAFAYGYTHTDRADFREAATDYFRTGAQHPFCLNCALSYSASKDSVNSVVFGHATQYFLEHGPISDGNGDGGDEGDEDGGEDEDSTPPSVSVSAPEDSAILFGTASLAATASDDRGVAIVQFTLNGADIGSPLTAEPYTLSLDTTQYPSGTYTLGAKAADAAGNVASSTTLSVSINQPPTAHLAASPVKHKPRVKIFNGKGSRDPEGMRLTYRWDFGDGTTGKGRLTTHRYSKSGSYTATLTVSDGVLSASESKGIVIP